MKKLLILLLTFTIAISCSKKSDPAPAGNSNTNTNTTGNPTDTVPTTNNNCSGTMTVNIDGKNYTPSGFANTLIITEKEGYGIRRLDIRTNVNGGTLVLTISNWDWQNPPTNGVVNKVYENELEKNSCKIVDGHELCDEMLGTFAVSNTEVYMTGVELPGNISISKVNTTNGTVSGTYNFTVEDFNDKQMTFSGTFTDQCYKVIKE